MANAQLNCYEKKVKTLMSKIPQSARNPHRFLDAALDSWEEKNEYPIFNFRKVSLAETEILITTLSNSTAAGHEGLDALAVK